MIRARALVCALPVLLCALLACTSETQVNLLEPQLSRDASTAPEAGGASDDAATADAAPSATHLIHRYNFASFGGDNTRIVDLVGGQNGVLKGGATLDGAGHATLDGHDDYVDLPNGLVSSLTNATLIAWLSWNGGNCWQRVFDFGSTDTGEDTANSATTSIFATPLRCPGSGPATAYETTTELLGHVDSDTPFPQLQNVPIAVVYDVTGGQMRLYAAGTLLGTGMAAPLSMLSDVNDWLGRSQWIQDDHLQGTYDEFRIYDIALSPAELAAVEKAGPDVVDP